MERFGCTVCWPEDPGKAFENMRSMHINARLVDESHFTVLLRSWAYSRYPALVTRSNE